jgi:hypothetical protein
MGLAIWAAAMGAVAVAAVSGGTGEHAAARLWVMNDVVDFDRDLRRARLHDIPRRIG